MDSVQGEPILRFSVVLRVVRLVGKKALLQLIAVLVVRLLIALAVLALKVRKALKAPLVIAHRLQHRPSNLALLVAQADL